MADREMYNTVETSVCGSIAVLAAATQTGTGVDLKGCEAATVSFIVGDAGIALSSTNKFTFSIQESDVLGSGYADVVDADILGATIVSGGIVKTMISSDDDESVYEYGYIGSSRYVRAIIVGGGTHSTGTPLGSTVTKGLPSLASVR